MTGTVDLKIRLEAKLTQDGDAWIACCPPLDLYTQSDTKDSAMAHLREAILAWFESCLERDVLPQALLEAGFQKTIPVHGTPLSEAALIPGESLAEVEVTIPAYIAAALGSIHAPC